MLDVNRKYFLMCSNSLSTVKEICGETSFIGYRNGFFLDKTVLFKIVVLHLGVNFMYLIAKVAFLSIVVVGCASPIKSVKQKWSESVRNFAVVPVYPMREDVFVGDVFIHRIHGEPYSLSSRRLGQIDAVPMLLESEKKRPSYPQSGVSPSREGRATAAWTQPTGSLLPKNGVPDRLRLAALPKVEILQLTSADVGAGGRAGNWKIVAGGQVESQWIVTVSLSGIETMEISDFRAAPMFLSYINGMMNNGDFVSALCMGAAALGDMTFQDIRVSMVTRALYARAIDYSYGDDSGAAFRLATGETVPTAGVAAKGNLGSNDPTAPSVQIQNLGGGSPGVTAGVSRVSKDGVSLTEIYERPLAFGVDVLSVKMELSQSDCSGNMGTKVKIANGGSGEITSLGSLD